MSGHNKWSKIKHKKAATDAVKSREFGKIARLIAQESKKSQGLESPGLRAAINKAKAVNMPSDNIDRAIKKGSGADAGNMEEVTYEAYGHGGSALIVTGLTDNKNRTSQEIKHILSKHGASLASPGAASWNFEKTEDGWEPKTTIPLSKEAFESLQTLVEALEENDDVQDVFTNAVSP